MEFNNNLILDHLLNLKISHEYSTASNMLRKRVNMNNNHIQLIIHQFKSLHLFIYDLNNFDVAESMF